MNFKVGNLVKDSHGNMGLITKHRKGYRFHVWVEWLNGYNCHIHAKHLELVCK